MDAEEEVQHLREMVARLRLSRSLLLRLLDESLREQEALQARLREGAGMSNVRHLPPRSAQDKGSAP
jgi:hypothetical protein